MTFHNTICEVCDYKVRKIMVPDNSNSKKLENSLKADGFTQPLMSIEATDQVCIGFKYNQFQ